MTFWFKIAQKSLKNFFGASLGPKPVFFLTYPPERVLQFFLILQNPPPPKVTKSTFYNTLEGPLVEQTTPGAFY